MYTYVYVDCLDAAWNRICESLPRAAVVWFNNMLFVSCSLKKQQVTESWTFIFCAGSKKELRVDQADGSVTAACQQL